MKNAPLLVCFLTVLAGCGCGKQAFQLAQGWTPPVKITESKEGLVGGLNLYKWRNTIMALQGLDDGLARCFTMDRDSYSWLEAQLRGVPQGYLWAEPAMDQTSDRVFFEHGYMENDQLVMNALVGHMDESVTVRDALGRKWVTDKKALFAEARSDIRLNDPGKPDWPSLGVGLINGSDFYIPYCLIGQAWRGNGVSIDDSLFNNGVFHSSDSGMTWQIENISDFEAWLPSLCKTKAFYYYFAAKNFQRDLWFACKPATSRAWGAPNIMTKTFANSALYWRYVAIGEDETVHVCWLDRRHEKTRLDLVYPQRENYEVAYCQRNDSSAGWSKDVILSKGLLYSYGPHMSVEGNRIVIAWAGIQTAPDHHKEHDPNDIYYTTSNDGGQTWARPLKVTDSVKDGTTSGEPKVMLLNGVIHLFYIQGKMNLKQESPGLAKLNQPPWPIYYVHRPFPN